MDEFLGTIDPFSKLRGRGVSSNEDGRFERFGHEFVDDGWNRYEDERLLRTEVTEEKSRTALSKNTSPDISFDRSINPYRGCEHGCSYCFARPTHAFLGLSPGLDLETRIIARPGLDSVLKSEISRESYQPAPIAIGTNTDPYQPTEKRYRVMEGILRVLREFSHPVCIVTKGTLIERDIEILADMAKDHLVRVGISVTTLDSNLCRALEPRAPTPDRRLKVIERLAKRGIPVRIMASPIVPALTDPELESILKSGAETGAVAASYIMLRLPLEVSALFREWLDTNCPDRADRVMAQVRAMHGGKDYSPEFGHRMRGRGPYADLVEHRFKLAARKFGLAEELPELDCSKFSVPGRGVQLNLL